MGSNTGGGRMKKKGYVTREEFDEHQESDGHLNLHTMAGLLFAIFLVSAIWIVLGQYDPNYSFMDKDVRSFLAEQYNFNESECVAWANVTKCVLFTKPDSPIGICHDQQVEQCSLYCHTVQVPDVEECKLMPAYEMCYEKVGLGNIVGIRGQRLYDDKQIDQINDCVAGTPEQEVCTPIYRNVTIFCADASTVAEARRLVG
jgi:hypothetical protein